MFKFLEKTKSDAPFFVFLALMILVITLFTYFLYKNVWEHVHRADSLPSLQDNIDYKKVKVDDKICILFYSTIYDKSSQEFEVIGVDCD